MTGLFAPTPLRRLVLASAFLLLSIFVQSSNGSSSSAAATTTTITTTTSPPPDAGSGGNPIGQLVGYVKDSLVRTVDGCGQLWKNHQKCNTIRSKQRDHRDKLQKKWELEGRLSREDIKRQLRSVNGGITYEEYAFLVKGKEDRGKLMNVMFLMWGAPRFLPYALMFYPEMLPSTFRFDSSSGSMIRESLLEKLSRERSHAVIQTLLNMEKDAKVIPSMSKINIFGKKAQQKRMETMEMMGSLTSKILTTPSVRGSRGASIFLNNLDQYFYRTDSEYTRGENRLMDVPKSLVRGVAALVEGPSPFGGLIPNFMNRGKIVTHIKKISECDEFLVQENIDLKSLDTAHLVEACSERLIGVGIGRTDDELRESLSEWLRLSVVQPSVRLQQQQEDNSGGKYYNGNLVKFSLLCYNALDAARDERSASYLPRTLFQGQIQDTQTLIEDVDAAAGNNKKN